MAFSRHTLVLHLVLRYISEKSHKVKDLCFFSLNIFYALVRLGTKTPRFVPTHMAAVGLSVKKYLVFAATNTA